MISNFSGGAPAEEGDWDPISPQASKHSQAVWILLWRDQVSRIECVKFLKIEMYIVHIKHVNISCSCSGSISFLSLLLAERCTSLCRSNPSKGKWSSSTTTMLHLKKNHGVLCWMCIELTVMLHIHYDFSCLFNCPCISSLIFIFSPLRLHQTLTASLWRPVTPKDGVSGVLWLLLSEPSPLPPILSLSECQARRTVDRIRNKLELTLSST